MLPPAASTPYRAIKRVLLRLVGGTTAVVIGGRGGAVIRAAPYPPSGSMVRAALGISTNASR